ncbi:cytochrome ubiquinol oxidase subunit I [bacterium]|nr:cytochrome ubiquinol oxidase subunit I [bacterium]
MDVELLSRLQFAFTAMFHYIFPPFSIGIGLLLVVFEGLHYFTKLEVYEKITRFWIKIFAATFSVGVASGIVLEFEFGTNWASYSRFVGDVFGSPLAAEGIFAFFLESGFLAVLLFGWSRVSRGFHLFSTLMVFVGSTLSAFWIVVANSWQQTPVAYQIVGEGVDAMAQITSFWGMVFNPSAMVRFSHVVVGSFLQGSFLVLSVSAFFILKRKYVETAQRSFLVALAVATVFSLSQLALGHKHADVVAEYQPAKLAAFEGLYESTAEAPMYVLGWTNTETHKTYGLKIPGMLSYLIAFDTQHKVPGLMEFPREDWPNAGVIFQTYHLMVAIGMLFIGLTLFASFLHFKNALFKQKWLLRLFAFSVVLPVVANEAGWVSAEMGRQPWTVYGLLRTADSLSKAVDATEVTISLIMFAVVYLLLFLVWIYVMDKEIKHGYGELKEGSAQYPEREKWVARIFGLNKLNNSHNGL